MRNFTVFEGLWEKNREKEGKGFILFKGKRFTGEVRGGKPDGKGVLNYRNGNKFEGTLS